MKSRLLALLLALVLSACAAVDVRDSRGKTPLYAAAESGDLSEVRRLVEAGSNMESLNFYPPDTPAVIRWIPGSWFTAGYRPLHAAAEKGHADVVKYLLINGADANPRSKQAETPLWVAARSHDDATVAEILAEHRAEVDAVDVQGVSPLIVAAETGHPAMVRFLLSKGALVERRSHDGRTALHHAAENGHEDVVEALLESEASPNQAMNDGRTALQVAVLGEHHGVVRMLLESGADPNQHREGTTPLLIAAAYSGHTESARLLLEYGAEADRTSEGWTALHHAANNNHADIVAALLQCGADIELREPESHQTALQMAVQAGHVEVVRVLLEYGADPDATIPPETPPLARAAREGYLEIVKLLVLFGADVNIKDGAWTPLRFAELGNHQAVADFLRESGGTY